eukprot:scaffold49527_cov53-Attheya_sp.AAC.4
MEDSNENSGHCAGVHELSTESTNSQYLASPTRRPRWRMMKEDCRCCSLHHNLFDLLLFKGRHHVFFIASIV